MFVLPGPEGSVFVFACWRQMCQAIPAHAKIIAANETRNTSINQRIGHHCDSSRFILSLPPSARAFPAARIAPEPSRWTGVVSGSIDRETAVAKNIRQGSATLPVNEPALLNLRFRMKHSLRGHIGSANPANQLPGSPVGSLSPILPTLPRIQARYPALACAASTRNSGVS